MNRTSEMSRVTPLVRRTRLRTGKPLPAKSRRQRRRDARWAGVRVTVLERDGGRCQFLGCTDPASEVHHRRGRATDADRYTVGLLVSLCRQHHDHVHANPAESYRTGLMVRRLGRAA